MQEEWVTVLQSPGCYPHATGEIQMLETHISWVLLTGDFVYKIKKPVNLGFLDFSTLERRKFYCEEELRLNSRFSEGLYLAVVALRGDQSQLRVDSVDADSTGSTGEVLEYAVKMRQFDQHALLDHIAREGRLGQDEMLPLARKLADFHCEVAAPLNAGNAESGTPETIADSALENFRQITPLLDNAERKSALERLLEWTRQQLAVLSATFAQRRAGGFVRECHGDLHLRNIAHINGEITFFDCIEFSSELRLIDTQSELAFVLMDLEKHHLEPLSNRLMNSYLAYTGDYSGLAVLPFYKVYRAMVRAKVAALGIKNAAHSDARKSDYWQEYDAYMALAQRCSELRQPFLGLMHGVSGSGKSTVAATVASELGAVQLRSDVERKRLFGLSPDARSEGRLNKELYGEKASARTLARLATLAGEILDQGFPVLVDATFIESKWRQPFFEVASTRAVPISIMDCRASPDTLRKRLRTRQAKQDDASEAGIEVMEGQLSSMEAFSTQELPHVIVVDTEHPLSLEALRTSLAKQARRAT